MVNVPSRIRLNTGDCQPAYETIDSFLVEVYAYVRERFNLPTGCGMHPSFEKRIDEMYHATGSATNGCVHYLKYRGCVVATVMETRTEFNYVEFNFFLNLENLIDAPSIDEPS